MNTQDPEETPLASYLCLALMRVGTRMASGFDRRYEPYGLTQAQFRLLLATWELGGMNGVAPSEIAGHLLLERATVSVMAQKLVERGFLVRVPGENRRTHHLVLTQAGGKQLREMGDKATTVAHETMALFTPSEQHVLQDLLARLESHLRHGLHSASTDGGENTNENANDNTDNTESGTN